MSAPTAALVTGASSGIGLEIARLLAADGRRLVLTARRLARLEEIAAQFRADFDVECLVVRADLAVAGGVRELEAAIEQEGLGIDILVNNAGFGQQGAFLETDLDRHLEMVRLNVAALTDLSWRYGREMAARGQGRILNVASTAAFQPGPWMAVYYATKAYVLSFSEALHHELAGSGVTVTALCPGPTHTGFQDAADMQDVQLFRAGAMDAATVARAGYRAMLRGRRRVVPGLSNRVVAATAGWMPRAWILRVVGRLNRP